MATTLQSRILSKQREQGDLETYLAAMEWDLVDPIVIESSQDLKSVPRWRESLKPYHHQVKNLITFCRRLPVTLLADDVGLGKTISAGLVLSELAARGRLQQTLIVCPKVLGPQWQEELATKFGIKSVVVAGRDLLDAEMPNGAVITTYQSARQYLKQMPEERFQMLILDEAHKLRNLHGVPKPPLVATVFRDALLARRFRYVLMLTATPLQNRLWDLYSLVDLLTVARGHKNPFGSKELFARRFILDDQETARRLRPESQEEFKSIVYGYMSRIRRGDAQLYFPERVVLMHRVAPTAAERRLIEVVAKFIAKMNPLAQISVLQALCSSPDALKLQLENMVEKGTAKSEFLAEVQQITKGMPLTAKIESLGSLIDKLSRENPQRWRMVVFTTRVQTQTTILLYLQSRGLKVGIINGKSGPQNSAMLRAFRADPPGIHIIVSTEAGSEGINLQAANVLVNLDLPWNPMIVEQRIGRVQRLASEHAKVSIYNVILKDTFEEYIVGRLMEKLQLASHAIGDIEALLESIDTDKESDGGSESFEERIRKLIVESLTGKDVRKAVQLAETSISDARDTLERERRTIDETLGAPEGYEFNSPRAPKFERSAPRLSVQDFTLRALKSNGAAVSAAGAGLWASEQDGQRELIRFADASRSDLRTTLYAPGSPALQRLIGRVAQSGIHDVEDADANPQAVVETIARKWADLFGGVVTGTELLEAARRFDGQAYVRVRATVAHDSFERLATLVCGAKVHTVSGGRSGLRPLERLVERPEQLGLVPAVLADEAAREASIIEFIRFYLERREQELRGAAGDDRKLKKLADEFTPNLEITFLGAKGRMSREVTAEVRYSLGSEHVYKERLQIIPGDGVITSNTTMAVCDKTGRAAPHSALRVCEISGAQVLEEILVKSERSGRGALPEHSVRCSVSGKRLLADEVEASSVSGALVDSTVLRRSDISGRRAEPEHLGTCEITGATVLKSELARSDISGKRFRGDQLTESVISGKKGHASEFVVCAVSGQNILLSETERCSVTHKPAIPALLATCEISGQRAIPSHMDRCSVTGKIALKTLLVRSSVSASSCLVTVAVRSNAGQYCLPVEARACAWSGRICHPDDVRLCELTGLSLHFDFTTKEAPHRLIPLVELLDARGAASDDAALWAEIAERANAAGIKGQVRVQHGLRSPNGECVAVSAAVKRLLGLSVTWAGYVYSKKSRDVLGRVALGRREATGWVLSS